MQCVNVHKICRRYIFFRGFRGWRAENFRPSALRASGSMRFFKLQKIRTLEKDIPRKNFVISVIIKIMKKIMVFGTFDGLHKGHIDFFKQAKNFTKNSFLIVSIGRDVNVLRVKGHRPDLSESKRLALVKKCKFVDKAVLAGKTNYLKHILKEGPDVIALGYDQKAYVLNLKKDIKNKNLKIKVIRLKPYKQDIYKSHLLKKKR